MVPPAFVSGSLQGHWWGFISRNYVVWPSFFLTNVFIALKGTNFLFLFLVKGLNFNQNHSCLGTVLVSNQKPQKNRENSVWILRHHHIYTCQCFSLGGVIVGDNLGIRYPNNLNPREFVRTLWHRRGIWGTLSGNFSRNPMEDWTPVQGIFNTK